jgi:hypothetical protein
MAKLNELACLLPSPSPVEAVETQRVSAQRVSVSAESASSALASAGGTDRDLAGPHFAQNCVPITL